MAQGRMTDSKAILEFLTAGKATVTFRNANTDSRFTYKVKFAPKREPNDADTWFVSLLNGPDNTSNFCYIGIIRTINGKLTYCWTSKAKVKSDAPSVKAFTFGMESFTSGRELAPSFEVYHEGQCGRCGRPLTVPESITSGFGPECVTKVAGGPKVRELFATAAAVGGTAVPQQQKFNYVPPVSSEPLAAVRVRVKGQAAALKALGGAGVAAALYGKPKVQTTADGGSFLDRPVQDIDAEIRRRIIEYKNDAPENYFQDGMLDEKAAFNVAYNMFRVQIQGGK